MKLSSTKQNNIGINKQTTLIDKKGAKPVLIRIINADKRTI